MSKRPTGDRHPDASSPQASVTEPPAACPPHVPERLFRLVYTIRAFELRCIKLYRRGLIRGYFHPYLGEEAIAAGVCLALDDRDYLVSTHRGHGHCIARGANLGRMMAELLGKETGYCGGRGGSMHIADFARGNLGANGIVGGGIPIGVGAALGARIRGEDRVAAIFHSDGAANNGVFTESLNLAAIWDLSAIFVLENNQYAVTTPLESVSRDPNLYKRGLAYGVESWQIDGNDALEVFRAGQRATALCRHGRGPVLIEAMTFRQMGHHVNDPGSYMPAEKVSHYRSRDPVDLAAGNVMRLAGATKDYLDGVKREVDAEIEAAVAYAVASASPSIDAFIEATRLYS